MMQETIIPNIRQEIKTIKITFELKKDLQDDEVICPHCHGTGLYIANNIYGIRGDTTHVGVHFPYKNQSLNFCKHCFNGVQRKCPECGALRGKHNGECPCGNESKKRRNEWLINSRAIWEKAEKISQEKAFQRFDCLYVDNMDRYVFNKHGLESVIDDFISDGMDISDLRVYGTTERRIAIDANSVIERACEDLHEEAAENCDTESLQEVLDAWCAEQLGTETYYPDYEVGVTLK